MDCAPRGAATAHAELEVVDRDPLVGRVDQPRGQLGAIARIGKKPYATVPNASRSQWLSVKPATQIGASARARLELGDERLDRRPRAAFRARERVPPWPSRHSSS